MCLPHVPDYAPPGYPVSTDENNTAHVWGAEYQYTYGNAKIDDDVPCAACIDTKAVDSIMIPGKATCPTGWRTQYHGHLCASHYSHAGASEYVCVDSDPQIFERSRQNEDGKLFYPAITVCGSLPCPMYENAKYLACVVCSK